MSAEDDVFTQEMQNAIKIHKKRLQLTTEEYKKRLDYENKLVKMRRMEQILTRAAPMGGLGGMAFGMLQNIGQAKMAGFQRLKELEGKNKLTPEEKEEKSMLEQSAVTNKLFGKLDKSFEKYFGGDSKWNKFFAGQGKTAAMGMGLGAIGGGMALGKMIIDSSPMMQQMMKLWKFGIMLVLKPIGDFFGFLFRPILLLLLRKFIIPNYQKIMPVMIKMGTDIGNFIVELEKLMPWNWGEAGKNYESNTTFTPRDDDPLFGTDGAIANWAKELENFDWDSIFPSVPKAYGDEMNESLLETQTGYAKIASFFSSMGLALEEGGWVNKKWNDATTFFDKIGSDTTTWVLQKFNDFTKFFSILESDVGGWVQEKVDGFFKFFSILKSDVGGWVKERWDKFTNFIAEVLGNVWETLGRSWNAFVNFFASLGNTVSYLGSLVGIKAANGYDGMVNKPTLMLVGERGSEHVKVTPHGQSSSSGTTVNISIGNMSGDIRDVQKLRKVILEVMQSVNTNRGR